MKDFAGEKTEQPTPRRLEQAVSRGQFPRSADVQTVLVLLAVLIALHLLGVESWQRLVWSSAAVFGHLHDIPVSLQAMQVQLLRGALVVAVCAGPAVVAALAGGLLAGSLQSKFQTASEALTPNWERVNPVAGFGRIFSFQSFVPTCLSLAKLALILGLAYMEVRRVLQDPFFSQTAEVASLARFMAGSALGILWRLLCLLAAIAALDYTYQFFKHKRELMMTREELKEEIKNTEGDPKVKARQRRRRSAKTQMQILLEVPKADVVVTNPTHLAVALRYDRRAMKAPRVVAKGARLNALKIRELAARHQVPILENKPLARLMFKHCRVGGEIPAQLFTAVAEILAWVYRVNRYRYYTQDHRQPDEAARPPGSQAGEPAAGKPTSV